jgi:hypothetical protein
LVSNVAAHPTVYSSLSSS